MNTFIIVYIIVSLFFLFLTFPFLIDILIFYWMDTVDKKTKNEVTDELKKEETQPGSPKAKTAKSQTSKRIVGMYIYLDGEWIEIPFAQGDSEKHEKKIKDEESCQAEEFRRNMVVMSRDALHFGRVHCFAHDGSPVIQGIGFPESYCGRYPFGRPSKFSEELYGKRSGISWYDTGLCMTEDEWDCARKKFYSPFEGNYVFERYLRENAEMIREKERRNRYGK